MCNAWIPLNQLRTGEKGRVAALDLSGNIRRRMLDLGMVTDTVVEMIGKSPFGDPTAYGIRGAMIAIRDKDASGIWIRPME